ncbi:MAG: cytochrome C oxidase subunit IV family protein [Alphaproteobacteria bacterium]|nr:cytochrome C oxidase subunit IV family protein [Alphaproteobacteria bacterium]
MAFALPSRRHLVVVWALLMLTTAASMWSGRVGVETPTLGPLWSSVLMGLSGVKVGLILWFYLNLRESTAGWKKGFVAFVGLIVLVILAAYMLTPEVAS